MRLLVEISTFPGSKISAEYADHLPPESSVLFHQLRSAGFLKECDEYLVDHMSMRYSRYHSWGITPDGWRALRLFQQQLDHLRCEAKKETRNQARDQAGRLAEKAAEKRLSWWQFWLGLFLGWLLGGFTPQTVLDWIKGVLSIG